MKDIEVVNKVIKIDDKRKCKIKLVNDHFENAKKYIDNTAQLIIADIPYNLGNNAYASNPMWYIDGDNKKGESKLAKEKMLNDIDMQLSIWD